jgi:hypothetical protein
MPETTFSCTSSRLVRRIALFRLFRIPLMLAVAMLCVCTIRETAACLSSEAETEQIALERPDGTDSEEVQSSSLSAGSDVPRGAQSTPPAALPTNPATSVKSAPPPQTRHSSRKGETHTAARSVQSVEQSPVTRPWLLPYAGKFARGGKGLVLTAHKTTAACGDLAIQLVGNDSALQSEMDKFAARLPTLAKALGPTSTPASPPASPEKSEPTAVVIINPHETHGKVSYLLNGKPHSLDAGQREELPLGPGMRVEFDRGGDFGKAAFGVTSGTYRFRVTQRGWDLMREEYPTSSPAKTAN